MRAIIDSDVLIDYLQGREQAKVELARYARREISLISWMEIMAGVDTPEEQRVCEAFLRTFVVHALDEQVAREAVALRRAHRLRLPDALIWATARVNHCLLVTRNRRDFPASEPDVRLPY